MEGGEEVDSPSGEQMGSREIERWAWGAFGAVVRRVPHQLLTSLTLPQINIFPSDLANSITALPLLASPAELNAEDVQ